MFLTTASYSNCSVCVVIEENSFSCIFQTVFAMYMIVKGLTEDGVVEGWKDQRDGAICIEGREGDPLLH